MSAMNQQASLQDADKIVAEAERAVVDIKSARAAIGKVIYGQESVIERALITILAGGHGLLIGVPGLAKTKLVETLGTVFGLSERRIQFTPDLMPSDIIGTEVMDQAADGSRSFRFVPGPVFAQLLMADEINRASPRTQSALLQAMQEYHVTVAGVGHDLPRPFHVLATQNPLEQEGTYPLPEAQLDRFLLQIDVLYPDRDAERRMLFETTGSTETRAEMVLDADRAARDPAARPPHAGRRVGRGGDPGAGALGAAGQQPRPEDRRCHRLGPRTARQPVADACCPAPAR